MRSLNECTKNETRSGNPSWDDSGLTGSMYKLCYLALTSFTKLMRFSMDTSTICDWSRTTRVFVTPKKIRSQALWIAVFLQAGAPTVCVVLHGSQCGMSSRAFVGFAVDGTLSRVPDDKPPNENISMVVDCS